MQIKPLCCILLTMSQYLVLADVSIDPIARTFTKTGGAGTVLTSGSGSWTATTDSDWIAIKPRTTGDAGVSCVYVVSKNMTTDVRVGQVIINGNVHTVTQTGYDATLDFYECAANMAGTNGVLSITVDAGIAWSISSDVDWVSFDALNGVGPATVYYTVAPYAGIVTRTASIRIAGENFTVTQTGKDVELTPTFAYVESDAGVVEVRVIALETTRWNVSVDAEWVYVVDGNTGSGDSTLIIAYASNESFKDRSATVSIGSTVFALKQKGVDKVHVNLSQYEVTANPSGAYGTIGVTATPDGPWSATSLSSWLTIASYGGEGNGTVEYVASPNLTLEPRIGTIEVVPAVRIPNPDIYAGLLVAFDLSAADKSSDSELSLSGSGHYWEPLLTNYGYYGAKELAGEDLVLGPKGEFSYAGSFCIETANQINRLFMIGNHSFYYDDANRLCLNASTASVASDIISNIWFTVLVEQTAGGKVKVFDGRRGEALTLRLDLEGINMFNGESIVAATNFVRNTTKQPSFGLLDGTFELQRIWNRTLADDELPYVDLIETELQDKPYMFSGVGCTYFPLDGNMYASTNGYGALPSMGWAWYNINETVTNRHGLANKAIADKNKISIKSFGPTMSFWMYLPQYPQTARVLISSTQTDGGSVWDQIKLTPYGKLGVRVRGEGNYIYTSEVLPLKEWFMITIVERLTNNGGELVDEGRVYLNGHEVAVSDWLHIYKGFKTVSISSSVAGISEESQVGVDDLCFYGSRLSSAQVLELFEKTKPVKKLYTVNQGIIEPALAPNQMQVAVEGGTEVVSLTLGPGVAWTAESNADWLTIPSGASGSGPLSITVNVAANPRAESRIGTITVAGLTLTVRQEPLWSEVENDTPFPPAEDGGYGIITVTTEGNAAWQAVSDASWLTIIDEGDHNGTDSVMWAADPYTDTTRSRTGTIRVADHIIYITQRGYELSVEPRSKTASSTGETGQIYVSADSEIDIWDVVATEPWINITSGATGAGSKTVTYTLDDNTSGITIPG